MSQPADVSHLLRAVSDGEPGALDQLLPRVYDELRGLARSCLAREGSGHTLQPTALVHEAWMKLARQDSMGAQHRSEFFTAAASVMRRILVDHARARNATKRGGGVETLALDETVAALEENSGDLIALDAALECLEQRDARKARLVELRFYAGLGMREAAEVLSVSLRQAERDWTVARAFLKSALDRQGA